MSFVELLLLAVGLAMDATAVAAAKGVVAPRLRPRHVVAVALWFGGAQALMPLIGWLIGVKVGPFVQAWDHWIVFAILGALGLKMLFDSGETPSSEQKSGDPFAWSTLFVLALATSIDALGAGFSLPLMGAALAPSVALIGTVTAVLSALGLFAGKHFGAWIGRRLDVVGGLVLIALGAKALIEHFIAH